MGAKYKHTNFYLTLHSRTLVKRNMHNTQIIIQTYNVWHAETCRKYKKIQLSVIFCLISFCLKLKSGDKRMSPLKLTGNVERILKAFLYHIYLRNFKKIVASNCCCSTCRSCNAMILQGLF